MEAGDVGEGAREGRGAVELIDAILTGLLGHYFLGFCFKFS